MALEGAVTGIAKIATIAVPVAVESVAKAAPAATEAIAQTAVQGAAEVGKTAIETGAEALGESAIKVAEAQASVLSEGIARSAELAMDAGGADAALSSISDVQLPGELSSPSEKLGTAITQNETVPNNVLSSSEDQINSAGATATENNIESPAASDGSIESLTSTEPTVSGSSIAEDQTAESTTDLVRSDGSQQEDSSEKQDNPKDEASAGSENTEKKKVLIPDEVLTREEYQEELNSIREEAESKGEEINEEDIQQKAFERYIKKLLNREDERAKEENRVKELEKKMKDMEDKMKEMIEQNEAMMKMVKDQADVIKQLSEWAAGSEKDEEKKKNLLKLIGEIAAIIAVGSVIEGGKTAAPPLGSPTG